MLVANGIRILVALGFLVAVASLAALVDPADARGPECAGKEATITQPNQLGQYVGTSGNDVIVSSALEDTVDGRGGRDTICSLEGNDTVFGYDGGDKILAGPDEDAVYGEGGSDVLRAGAGNDFLVGSSGRDRCIGGDGTDTVPMGGSCEERRSIENG